MSRSDHRDRQARRVLSILALGVLLCGGPGTASAAELTAFLSGASPSETWGRGYGGMFTISLFNIVHGDVEGAYQSSDLADTSFSSLAAKAYLGPSIGRLVPYGGLGVGAYSESLPNGSDKGSYGLVLVGLKLKFPMGLVLRAEYQWVSLPSGVKLDMSNRYLFGAGLSF